jgi:hypothetical protein
MMEVGAVVDRRGMVIHWHMPEGRDTCALPDSRNLWTFLLENKDVIQGVAHSHPGGGSPGPSHTDVTTFAAIEVGLGRRLDWWITSSDAMVVCRWVGPNRLSYAPIVLTVEPLWADRLRELSDNGVADRLLDARRAVMGYLDGGARPTEDQIKTIRRGWGM